jgi:hypothetical protein
VYVGTMPGNIGYNIFSFCVGGRRCVLLHGAMSSEAKAAAIAAHRSGHAPIMVHRALGERAGGDCTGAAGLWPISRHSGALAGNAALFLC